MLYGKTVSRHSQLLCDSRIISETIHYDYHFLKKYARSSQPLSFVCWSKCLAIVNANIKMHVGSAAAAAANGEYAELLLLLLFVVNNGPHILEMQGSGKSGEVHAC